MPANEELLQVRIPRELWARLERTATSNGERRSALTRRLLEDGLEMLDLVYEAAPPRPASVPLDSHEEGKAEPPTSQLDEYEESGLPPPAIPARVAVFAHIDALNNLFDLISRTDQTAAVRLAFDAGIACNRWADVNAPEMRARTERIPRSVRQS